MKGWMGKILRIDLSNKMIIQDPLDLEISSNFLGGAGINAYFLYQETSQNTKPLGPDNVLVFGAGALTGTLAPCSSRLEVTTKSPLTGIFGDSNCGGDFGPELKYAGYDHLLFQGSAESPFYLWIDDGDAELRDAENLWGRDVFETHDMLVEEHGENIKTACIGPAAENGVLYGNILINKVRALGRTGAGTVMANKNLKAIAVRGFQDIELAKPKEMRKVSDEILNRLESNPMYEDYGKYGTLLALDHQNEIGGLPVKNRQDVKLSDEFYEKNLSSKVFHDKLVERDVACFNCPIHCSEFWRIRDGPYAGEEGEKIELTTAFSFGPNLGNYDPCSIAYFGKLANKYGFDYFEFSHALALAMECFQEGVISEEETGGLSLEWGNKEIIEEMIRRVGEVEGFGRVLAKGSWRASKELGEEAEKFSQTIKKQGLPANDPRNALDWGLGYATATRGACHLKAFPFINKAVDVQFAKEELQVDDEKLLDPTTPEGIGKVVAWSENWSAALDSLGLCKFLYNYLGFYGPVPISPDIIGQLFYNATGIKMTGKGLKKCGERIYNLEKAYNVREGLGIEDDVMPERTYSEPAPSGVRKGKSIEGIFEEMREEYYEARNWDKETGLPTREKLRELDLDAITSDNSRIS